MQPRSEGTRKRILEAAQQVFSTSGYEGSGVAEICQQAGVSKGAFYHHFQSKQEVFLALLNEWLGGLEQRLAAFGEHAEDAPQALHSMSSAVEEVFSAADNRLSMFLEFWAQASRDPVFWKATVAPYHQYQAFFTQLVQSGVDKGSFRPVEASIVSRVIIALAVGVLFQGLLDPQGSDWQKVTQAGMNYLVRGIGAEGK